MKLTQRQLRKLIREATDQSEEVLVRSLLRALGRQAEDLGNGEVYVMTGEADGIVVKVVRRGR